MATLVRSIASVSVGLCLASFCLGDEALAPPDEPSSLVLAGSKKSSTRVAGYVVAALGLLMLISGSDSHGLGASESDSDDRYNVGGIDLLGAGLVVLGYRRSELPKSYEILYRPKSRSLQLTWNLARW
jgi:hypothetical protein